MESTANLHLVRRMTARQDRQLFFGALVLSAALSAVLASWVPLQFSIVTVFLFAGPHNWFELRYFLMRLPVRFGRSRNFFVTAFAGIGLLTIGYIALPLLYYSKIWSPEVWPTAIAAWNTAMVLWVAALCTLRSRLRPSTNWTWIWPASFALLALNWIEPELFGLGIVYLHPLIALWFLDRHLMRTRHDWSKVYRCCLLLLPIVLAALIWRLWGSESLSNDNGLSWRITQHAGGDLLSGVSTHLLVSLHVFLETLHYGVWVVALPLIGARGPWWKVKTIPLARHPRGFPRFITAALVAGLFIVAVLWFGFSIDYAITRDIYFAVAIAHVLAEAPFLLRML